MALQPARVASEQDYTGGRVETIHPNQYRKRIGILRKNLTRIQSVTEFIHNDENRQKCVRNRAFH